MATNFDTRALVVMGVCGCGKTTIGEELANRLGWRFLDGDSLHPPENVSKMSQGIPLNDEDRKPWLESCAKQINSAATNKNEPGLVLGCSALKKSYREILRGLHSSSKVKFVYLKGSVELITQRMKARTGHFMPSTLVGSQFAALESPEGQEGVVTVDISQDPLQIVSEAFEKLAA